MGERLVLAEEQYQEHVNTYRHQMWAIRDQWYFMQERLKDMLYPNCELVYRDCITFLHRAIMPPNEIPLTYPRLRQLENGDFVYKEETKMYGGKLVENIMLLIIEPYSWSMMKAFLQYLLSKQKSVQLILWIHFQHHLIGHQIYLLLEKLVSLIIM
jgi:hypothetical protein